MSVLYGGVDYSIPGNGGPDCVYYTRWIQKVLETAVIVPLFFLQSWSAYRTLEIPEKFFWRPYSTVWRRVILGTLCMVFGAELAFKLANKTLIYILNPCHVVTAIQIFLLLSEPDNWLACLLFRFHMYLLPGATLALVFPVVNTRFLPFEVDVYYIQHWLILVIPLYLMNIGGAYTAEPLLDTSWCLFSIGINSLYHFLPLQILGLWTQVNLNSVICPAISDPFRGKYWRLCAIVHQSLYIPFHTKLYTTLANFIISQYRYCVSGGEENRGHNCISN